MSLAVIFPCPYQSFFDASISAPIDIFVTLQSESQTVFLYGLLYCASNTCHVWRAQNMLLTRLV